MTIAYPECGGCYARWLGLENSQHERRWFLWCDVCLANLTEEQTTAIDAANGIEATKSPKERREVTREELHEALEGCWHHAQGETATTIMGACAVLSDLAHPEGQWHWSARVIQKPGMKPRFQAEFLRRLAAVFVERAEQLEALH